MILEGLMTDLGWILFAVALIFGFLGGSALIYFLPIMQKRRAENNAKKIISQAENKADRIVKNAQLDGKQTINELKQEAEKNCILTLILYSESFHSPVKNLSFNLFPVCSSYHYIFTACHMQNIICTFSNHINIDYI